MDLECLLIYVYPPELNLKTTSYTLHPWTAANVNINLIVDSSVCQKNSSMVISKDAKAIARGDIAPVDKPGRAWK